MPLLALIPLALATAEYDPTAPAQRFTGQEVYTIDGSFQLWSAIERHEDPDRRLFGQDTFNSATEWPSGAAWAPWIVDCFGDASPHSSSFLLHMGVHEATATGTPILFVPGAGDNGSRGFITMATNLDADGRPVYAITFAHPHGDVFQHAEVIADAIARIKERTGAEQVDLVAHSKGGVSAAVYVSHTASADWGGGAYERVGTPYRGDVRRLVLAGTPLGGIDTAYRWTSINLLLIDADTAMAPTSWSTYYPSTSTYYWIYSDLEDQDMHPTGMDLFPGQRQILARQSPTLPGEMPWLGSYAVQWDWYTTYEGGLGFYSSSNGIDDAIADGGDLIAKLADQGADPEVEIFLLAGENPIMPNASQDYLAQIYGQAWIDLATVGTDIWAALGAQLVGQSLVSQGFEQEDVQGLAQGKLVLGEITGPSDGLVFVDSATKEAALTGRGATISQTYVANLSHLDLLNASVTYGAQLVAEADADPVEDGWKAAVGRRFIEADTIGWLREVLADPEDTGVPSDDTGISTDDTGGADDTGVATDDSGAATDDSSATDDTGSGGGDGKSGGRCGVAPAAGAWALFAALGLAVRRRRR
ncbi:MAG: hypothetical protein H6739_41035 [Alphaproteobacteria bacterium]|nr:hypothetical protein [Alphaproteobacteria bacterium]